MLVAEEIPECIFLFSHPSPKLPWAALRAEQSLLLSAAQSGDSWNFANLIDYLEPFGDVGQPEYPEGMLTIPEIVVLERHFDFLDDMLRAPFIFPR